MNKFIFIISFLLSAVMSVAQQQCNNPIISGYITYDNSENTPLSPSKVFLFSSSGQVTDSCLTNNTGYFQFCSVSQGSYTLSVLTEVAWGGVNSVDALLALRHFVSGTYLNNLRTRAGDVNGNTIINSSDALTILKRFSGLQLSFIIPDWIFEQANINVGVAPLSLNIKAICAGDLDGSYIPPVICDDTLIDNRDGQKYPIVQIGSRCWMKKNLNIGLMVTSTPTQFAHSDCNNDEVIEKYCYNNDPLNCQTYGGLYDWDEMMNYTPQIGGQGICPNGWHIPSNDEWCSMATFLDPSVNCTPTIYTGSTIGAKLKESGTLHWNSPNTGATNESGFTALGHGNRGVNGGFGLMKRNGNYWSSNGNSTYYPIYWIGPIYNTTTIVFAVTNFNQTGYKKSATAIRCIRN